MATNRADTVNDASLWHSGDFSDPGSFTVTLDRAMRRDLLEVTRLAFNDRLNFGELTPVQFPLPTMKGLLDDIIGILEDGRGFIVLRGIPVDELTPEESALGLAGITAHLGELVCQSVHRNKIEEITDRKQRLDHASRGYNGTRAVPFHTDGGDYAALLCLAAAFEGGESVLASGARVPTTRSEHSDPTCWRYCSRVSFIIAVGSSGQASRRYCRVDNPCSGSRMDVCTSSTTETPRSGWLGKASKSPRSKPRHRTCWTRCWGGPMFRFACSWQPGIYSSSTTTPFFIRGRLTETLYSKGGVC